MKLIQESSDALTPQLITLGKNLNLVLSNEGKIIDCSDLKWVSPLSILPLSATISAKEMTVEGENEYLKTISFPHGITDPGSLPIGKTYLPIVRFSSVSEMLMEKLTSGFIELLLQQVGFRSLVLDAFHYAIGEMVTNISEHSQSEHGWILAQYYRSKEFLDVVLLDQGFGFKRVYEKAFGQTYTDQGAIEKALEGFSVKKDKERGYGLWTTKKLVTQSELNGKFLIISGSKGYFADNDRELWFNLPSWHWQGAIVILRMNKVKNKINLYDYVE